MKIAIMCESELLQQSLEFYLKKHIAPLNDCDFVLSDYDVCDIKPVCIVGESDSDIAHIKKPFTKQSLIHKLRAFKSAISNPNYKIQTLSAHDTYILNNISKLMEETLLEFKQKVSEIIISAPKESSKK